MEERTASVAPTEGELATAPRSDDVVDHRLLHELQTELIDALLNEESAKGVFDRICRAIEARVENSVCSIMMLDPVREGLFVQAAPCIAQEFVDELDGFVPCELAGSCGTAVHTGRTTIVEDTSTDPHWESLRAFAERAGIRACWSIPVRSRDETVAGSFAISRFVTGGPTPTQLAVLEAAAGTACLAIRRQWDERDAAKEHELIQAVVEGTQDCIWIKNVDGEYVYVNRAEGEASGHGVDGMIGKIDDQLYPPVVARKFRATDFEVFETGKPVVYLDSTQERECQIDYHVRKTPRFDESGHVIGVIGIARDVSDQEQAKRALQQAQKLESLGLLAGGIAHDFNNILVGIVGNAELLREDLREDPAALRAVAEIRHAADRAKGLTRQILSYAGKGPAARDLLDVRDLLEDVLLFVHGSLLNHVDLDVTWPSSLPPVFADANQIRQVLMNLLVNAAEAVADSNEGRVEVSATSLEVKEDEAPPTVEGRLSAGEYVEICVDDNGEGMDADRLDRIFDPFFTTKISGRGLGLAAVLGILKSHGGAIAVTSRPGRGTMFRVYLPHDARRGETTAAGPTVLIVDDEPMVRSVMSRMLESVGFHTLTAENGSDALQLIENAAGSIDAAIIDYNLPGISGLDVVRRSAEFTRDIPVVLVTGGGDAAMLEATELFVMTKPFTLGELTSALRSVGVTAGGS